MRTVVRVRASGVAALGLLAAAVMPVQAFTIDNWNGHYTSEYPENVTCVSASAVTEIRYIYNDTTSADYSHTVAWNWYQQARFGSTDHDKYHYGSEAGLDPRAWAWLLWYYSPGTQSYHDYWSTNQSSVDVWLMSEVRDSGPAAGAIVFRGTHAVDIIGFSATADPDDQPATLTGVYIADPWTGGTNQQITERDGGTLGLAPNTWLSTSTWNSDYFSKYADPTYENAHGNTIWHGAYTVVLRTQDGYGQPTPAGDTMPTKYSDNHSGAAMVDPTIGTDPGYPDPETAVVSGIENSQINAASFAIDLNSARLGQSTQVTSLSADIAPYELVEVLSHGKVAAVAMLRHTTDGWHLAGLQSAYAGNQIVDVASARSAFGARGVHTGTVTAAWMPSAASYEPFSPLYLAGGQAGSTQALVPGGAVLPLSSISVVR